MLKTPFDGKLQLQEVSLGGIQKVLDVPSLNGMAGMASGNVALKNEQRHAQFARKRGAERWRRAQRQHRLSHLARLPLHRPACQRQRSISTRPSYCSGQTPLSICRRHQWRRHSRHRRRPRHGAERPDCRDGAPGFGLRRGLQSLHDGEREMSRPTFARRGRSPSRLSTATSSGKDIHVSGGELKQPVEVTRHRAGAHAARDPLQSFYRQKRWDTGQRAVRAHPTTPARRRSWTRP